MNRKKIATLAAIALLLPTLALAVGPVPRVPRAEGLAKRVVERLELTPEQVQDIREILASHKPELTAELVRVKAARSRMFEAIHAPDFDEAAIRNAAAAVGRAETELAVTRGHIVEEVRQVLTPEQREEAQEMLADARAFVDEMIARWKEHVTNDPFVGL